MTPYTLTPTTVPTTTGPVDAVRVPVHTDIRLSDAIDAVERLIAKTPAPEPSRYIASRLRICATEIDAKLREAEKFDAPAEAKAETAKEGEGPRWEHDCGTCVFLAREGPADLYFCTRFGGQFYRRDGGIGSMIMRGDCDYINALRLARERGLVAMGEVSST